MNDKEQTALIGRDAEEFGNHVRQGGWRLGLLVARSVEKGKNNGRPKTVAAATVSDFEKWSASEFARRAGTSTDRVLRYLRGWDDAATDGWVPESALLVPGEEIDGLDVDTLPDWAEYYPPNDKVGADKLNRYTVEAEKAGTTTAQTANVARHKPAIAAAIMADPEVEKVARRTLIQKEIQRDAQRATEKRRNDVIRDPAPVLDGTLSEREIADADDQFDELMIKLRAMHRNGQDALSLTLGLHGFQQKSKRNMVVDTVGELRAVLDAIEEAAKGRSMDDELAALLEGGR